MDGLVIGKMVHHVSRRHEDERQHQPAIVTHIWSQEQGSVQLMVLDNPRPVDTEVHSPWSLVTSAIYDPEGSSGSWHELGPCERTDLPKPDDAEELTAAQ